MAAINFDPYKSHGTPAGMFNVESRGLTQGDAHDDPAVRLQLCSGSLVSGVPIWAGVGLIECIPNAASSISGAMLKPASATQCNAFAVSNQAFHAIMTPGNSVPQFVGGGSVHYYRIGSGARIPLPITAAVADLAISGAEPVESAGFFWDPENNIIDVYVEGTTTQPKLNINLLMVSIDGNMTVAKEADGSVVWKHDMPCGLFLI